jgi:hypothetical protein
MKLKTVISFTMACLMLVCMAVPASAAWWKKDLTIDSVATNSSGDVELYITFDGLTPGAPLVVDSSVSNKKEVLATALSAVASSKVVWVEFDGTKKVIGMRLFQ